MSTPTERFVAEITTFLAKPYNGQFKGEAPELRKFAMLMRRLHNNLRVDPDTILELCDEKWLLLTPEGADRERLPDWRFNPSLVSPLIAATVGVLKAQTCIALIHETGALLRAAATIEDDAEQQRYRLKPDEICDVIRAFDAYGELVAPVRNVVAAIAQSNVGDLTVSIESPAFVADRDGIPSCVAAVFLDLLVDDELHSDLGDMPFGPYVINFSKGACIRTTYPPLALVYAVTKSALAALASRQATSDIRRQLEIARGWATAMQLSDPIQGDSDPFTYLRRAELLVAVYDRDQPLRALFSAGVPLAIDASNQIYSLVAPELMLARYDRGRALDVVDRRREHLRLCKTLVSSLLPFDAKIGRSIDELIDEVFVDLEAAPYPLAERHRDMLEILQQFFFV